jgi:hypothetical protein
MKKPINASAAFVAMLGAIAFTATAEAGRGHGGHGGHGHHGHGHHGHWHGGHHHHGWWGRPRVGLWAPPAYAYYDDFPGDCYRVYRRGRYRVICD